ncbi:hypothetical protein RDI58_022796 [Solanum bulbocastanum]|uniref:Uncharacterized protein n=1 Tax=Solanum bulbocastanum TaxID=147425 RepID=A0AAN8Y640_SOLBU
MASSRRNFSSQQELVIKTLKEIEKEAHMLQHSLLCRKNTLLIERRSVSTCLTFEEDKLFKEVEQQIEENEELLNVIEYAKIMIDEE